MAKLIVDIVAGNTLDVGADAVRLRRIPVLRRVREIVRSRAERAQVLLRDARRCVDEQELVDGFECSRHVCFRRYIIVVRSSRVDEHGQRNSSGERGVRTFLGETNAGRDLVDPVGLASVRRRKVDIVGQRRFERNRRQDAPRLRVSGGRRKRAQYRNDGEHRMALAQYRGRESGRGPQSKTPTCALDHLRASSPLRSRNSHSRCQRRFGLPC